MSTLNPSPPPRHRPRNGFHRHELDPLRRPGGQSEACGWHELLATSMGSRYQRPDKTRLSVPASICRLQYLCWHAGAQTRKHKTQNNRNARISAAFLTLCTRFSKPWHAICKAEGQRAKVSLSTTSASCHPSPVLCISLISWRLSQNRRATSAKNGIRAPNTHTHTIHP